VRFAALPGGLDKAVDEVESMFEWIAGILTAGLLAYLAVALLKPEWFS
jgi:K+-transporting ATPase KdpF subunit